jgi:O-antigen ligase
VRFLAIAFILLTVPLFCVLLRQGRRHRLWAYAMIGFLPFTLNAWHLFAALINWAGWPGHTQGAVITIVDSLALAILITHRNPKKGTPIVAALSLYFFAAAVSIFMSDMPMATVFYAFQLTRIILLTAAIARIAPDRESLRWLAFGLAGGITFQAVITVSQKAGGALQAAGTLGHQNTLGMMAQFVLLPLLAMMLGGERSKLMLLGVVSSLLAIALGASRGAVGFAGIGLSLLFVFSLARRTTGHKWRSLGICVILLSLIAPLAYMGLQNRFAVQGTQSGAGEERLAFERAAKAMWHDHPMGVGANMYIITANSKGYSDRAGVNWSSGRATNVHNVYLLVAAETGWLGLLSLIGLFATAIITGMRFAFTNRREIEGEVVLGCTIALITVAIHSFFEWILVLYQTQYLMAISLGVVAGLDRQRRMAARRAKMRLASDFSVLLGGTAVSELPSSAMPAKSEIQKV